MLEENFFCVEQTAVDGLSSLRNSILTSNAHLDRWPRLVEEIAQITCADEADVWTQMIEANLNAAQVQLLAEMVDMDDSVGDFRRDTPCRSSALAHMHKVLTSAYARRTAVQMMAATGDAVSWLQNARTKASENVLSKLTREVSRACTAACSPIFETSQSLKDYEALASKGEAFGDHPHRVVNWTNGIESALAFWSKLPTTDENQFTALKTLCIPMVDEDTGAPKNNSGDSSRLQVKRKSNALGKRESEASPAETSADHQFNHLRLLTDSFMSEMQKRKENPKNDEYASRSVPTFMHNLELIENNCNERLRDIAKYDVQTPMTFNKEEEESFRLQSDPCIFRAGRTVDAVKKEEEKRERHYYSVDKMLARLHHAKEQTVQNVVNETNSKEENEEEEEEEEGEWDYQDISSTSFHNDFDDEHNVVLLALVRMLGKGLVKFAQIHTDYDEKGHTFQDFKNDVAGDKTKKYNDHIKNAIENIDVAAGTWTTQRGGLDVAKWLTILILEAHKRVVTKAYPRGSELKWQWPVGITVFAAEWATPNVQDAFMWTWGGIYDVVLSHMETRIQITSEIVISSHRKGIANKKNREYYEKAINAAPTALDAQVTKFMSAEGTKHDKRQLPIGADKNCELSYWNTESVWLYSPESKTHIGSLYRCVAFLLHYHEIEPRGLKKGQHHTEVTIRQAVCQWMIASDSDIDHPEDIPIRKDVVTLFSAFVDTDPTRVHYIDANQRTATLNLLRDSGMKNKGDPMEQLNIFAREHFKGGNMPENVASLYAMAWVLGVGICVYEEADERYNLIHTVKTGIEQYTLMLLFDASKPNEYEFNYKAMVDNDEKYTKKDTDEETQEALKAQQQVGEVPEDATSDEITMLNLYYDTVVKGPAHTSQEEKEANERIRFLRLFEVRRLEAEGTTNKVELQNVWNGEKDDTLKVETAGVQRYLNDKEYQKLVDKKVDQMMQTGSKKSKDELKEYWSKRMYLEYIKGLLRKRAVVTYKNRINEQAEGVPTVKKLCTSFEVLPTAPHFFAGGWSTNSFSQEYYEMPEDAPKPITEEKLDSSPTAWNRPNDSVNDSINWVHFFLLLAESAQFELVTGREVITNQIYWHVKNEDEIPNGGLSDRIIRKSMMRIALPNAIPGLVETWEQHEVVLSRIAHWNRHSSKYDPSYVVPESDDTTITKAFPSNKYPDMKSEKHIFNKYNELEPDDTDLINKYFHHKSIRDKLWAARTIDGMADSDFRAHTLIEMVGKHKTEMAKKGTPMIEPPKDVYRDYYAATESFKQNTGRNNATLGIDAAVKVDKKYIKGVISARMRYRAWARWCAWQYDLPEEFGNPKRYTHVFKSSKERQRTSLLVPEEWFGEVWDCRQVVANTLVSGGSEYMIRNLVQQLFGLESFNQTPSAEGALSNPYGALLEKPYRFTWNVTPKYSAGSSYTLPVVPSSLTERRNLIKMSTMQCRKARYYTSRAPKRIENFAININNVYKHMQEQLNKQHPSYEIILKIHDLLQKLDDVWEIFSNNLTKASEGHFYGKSHYEFGFDNMSAGQLVDIATRVLMAALGRQGNEEDDGRGHTPAYHMNNPSIHGILHTNHIGIVKTGLHKIFFVIKQTKYSEGVEDAMKRTPMEVEDMHPQQ